MRLIGSGGGGRTTRPTMSARRALGIVVMTLSFAALFNAPALLHDSKSKPFGGNRDFWLRIWRPADAVSRTLLLDRPRRALDSITGHGPGGNGSPALVIAPTVAPNGGQSIEPPATPVPAATATPLPHVRVPSAQAPLQISVVGDSLVERLGESLARQAAASGVMSVDVDARISTGLSRPDVFDWPARIAQISQQDRPDVIVILFGGNDSQGVRNPQGEVYQTRTDGWRTEYRRRVALAMSAAVAPGRLVFWVGLPAMRDPGFSASMGAIDGIVREEASAHDGITYIDSHAILGGGYAAYLPDAGGAQELVREPDGIHVTRAGGDRVASEIVRLIRAEISQGALLP